MTKHWRLASDNENLARILPDQPIVSYRKEKSLKHYLVKGELL